MISGKYSTEIYLEVVSGISILRTHSYTCFGGNIHTYIRAYLSSAHGIICSHPPHNAYMLHTERAWLTFHQIHINFNTCNPGIFYVKR